MKRLLFYLLNIILGIQIGYTQINSIVAKPELPKVTCPIFTTSWDKTTAKVGDVVTLTWSAPIPAHVHFYSEKTNCPADDGPIRAEFTIPSIDGLTPIGKYYGIGDKLRNDEIFGCATGEFHNKAVFQQKFKVTKAVELKSAKMDFRFQMCYDEDFGGACFNFTPNTCGKPLLISTNLKIEGSTDASPTIDTSEKTVDSIAPIKENTIATPGYKSNGKDDIGKCQVKKFEGKTGGEEKKSYWAIFIAALISGIVALVTPCVFPMIPMTVSFFLKNTDRKKAIRDAIVFAISIIVIYVIIGTIFAQLTGEKTANWLSTHWIPNVFFFAIFVVFAFSFFGAFEIVLPSSWITAVDRKADKGGFTGPIFMAITIALVSFSCTGPIIGTLLVQSAQGGNVMQVIVGMFGFSLAFALPFGLLVVFPSWLSNLPKSGGWLNSVKVVLGFVELGFALKFLSTADQTYHWHILDREVYLSLWIVLAFLLGVYLLGKLKFAHDSDLPFLKVPRFLMAIASFAFAVYMLPGLWGAPLKFLAGYLPPSGTQDFDINRSIYEANGKTLEGCSKPKYGETLHIPHGIQGYFDYEQALSCAKEQNKPLFIDFTGHGCVNCRKMEEKVWSNPSVLNKLKNDFVVVSLYVDDKILQLPKEEQYISKRNGEKITLLADKNADIQICYFDEISQPMYAIMDAQENLMVPKTNSQDVNFDAKLFDNWLLEGLTYFRKMHPKK